MLYSRVKCSKFKRLVFYHLPLRYRHSNKPSRKAFFPAFLMKYVKNTYNLILCNQTDDQIAAIGDMGLFRRSGDLLIKKTFNTVEKPLVSI